MKGQYLGRYGKNVKNVNGLRGGAIGMKDIYLGGYGMSANDIIGVLKNVVCSVAMQLYLLSMRAL